MIVMTTAKTPSLNAMSRAFSYETCPSRNACRRLGSAYNLRSNTGRCFGGMAFLPNVTDDQRVANYEDVLAGVQLENSGMFVPIAVDLRSARRYQTGGQCGGSCSYPSDARADRWIDDDEGRPGHHLQTIASYLELFLTAP